MLTNNHQESEQVRILFSAGTQPADGETDRRGSAEAEKSGQRDDIHPYRPGLVTVLHRCLVCVVSHGLFHHSLLFFFSGSFFKSVRKQGAD